jgi:DNA-binding NarL/FixJ family response regulator
MSGAMIVVPPPLPDPLSVEELLTLRLLASGMTERGIARGSHWSEWAVQCRCRAIRRKLGVPTIVAAVALALRLGLIR